MIREEDDGYCNNAIDLVDEVDLNKIDKNVTNLVEKLNHSTNFDKKN